MLKDLNIEEAHLASDEEDEDTEDQEVLSLNSLLTDSSKCFRRPNIAHHPLANGCDDNWTWNLKDKSDKVTLYGPKRRIAHFHPNWSNGTAGVRGLRALNQGRFYWEINVSQRIFGTRSVPKIA